MLVLTTNPGQWIQVSDPRDPSRTALIKAEISGGSIKFVIDDSPHHFDFDRLARIRQRENQQVGP